VREDDFTVWKDNVTVREDNVTSLDGMPFLTKVGPEVGPRFFGAEGTLRPGKQIGGRGEFKRI
jgi:hypothetical protein